ncbi:MAG: hypothetical protein ACLR1E_02430 [Coprococcus sp.]
MKKILRFLLVFAAMFCMTCFTAFAEDTDDPDTYYLELDAAGGQLSGGDFHCDKQPISRIYDC